LAKGSRGYEVECILMRWKEFKRVPVKECLGGFCPKEQPE
jgi:hypothetical protein